MTFLLCCSTEDGPVVKSLRSAMRNAPTTRRKVGLAITSRGMGGITGYHSSVLIDDKDYVFSRFGITTSTTLESHGDNADTIFIGYSRYSGDDLVTALKRHFKRGTYDILRKNCNSFSDCALYFLCGARLPWSLSAAEKVGRAADDSLGIVQALYGPSYAPNRKARNFDLEVVMVEIDSWASLGSDDDDNRGVVVDLTSDAASTCSTHVCSQGRCIIGKVVSAPVFLRSTPVLLGSR
mmetsp:Transcript_131711/g.421416  ORF Transcript_131711/g.421416 Transcript_131711/m.421416 type:complete len:237 (-) Transcript_131711:202-912(-)